MLHAIMFRSLWAYRGFVLGAVRREFEQRYRGSIGGAVWAVLQPLSMILVFTVVFSGIMRNKLPGHEDNPFAYSIYLCAGVLPWGLFNDLVGRLTTVFTDSANLMKKASFPRVCLPVIAMLGAALSFSVPFALFASFVLIVGQWPGVVILAALPLLVLTLMVAAGLGLLLGTLNVFFRDVSHLTSIVLQFWFWLTPLVYVATSLPESVRQWLELNPLWPLFRGWHGVFVDRVAPAWLELLPLALGASLLLLLAGLFFVRRAPDMVDDL
jgi:lipopolysaccharide transport system permease protein